jgi:hypothetical protein
MLVALFPHVSQNAFTRANEITEEKTAIKQDLFFMQFLNGQLDIPLDPDTTMEKRTLPGKHKEVFDSQSSTYKTIIMPIIPREYQKLYTKLLSSLPEKKTELSSDFIPPHLMGFHKKQEQWKKQEAARIAKKRGEKAQKQAPLVTQHPSIEPITVEISQDKKIFLQKNLKYHQ